MAKSVDMCRRPRSEKRLGSDSELLEKQAARRYAWSVEVMDGWMGYIDLEATVLCSVACTPLVWAPRKDKRLGYISVSGYELLIPSLTSDMSRFAVLVIRASRQDGCVSSGPNGQVVLEDNGGLYALRC